MANENNKIDKITNIYKGKGVLKMIILNIQECIKQGLLRYQLVDMVLEVIDKYPNWFWYKANDNFLLEFQVDYKIIDLSGEEHEGQVSVTYTANHALHYLLYGEVFIERLNRRILGDDYVTGPFEEHQRKNWDESDGLYSPDKDLVGEIITEIAKGDAGTFSNEDFPKLLEQIGWNLFDLFYVIRKKVAQELERKLEREMRRYEKNGRDRTY